MKRLSVRKQNNIIFHKYYNNNSELSIKYNIKLRYFVQMKSYYEITHIASNENFQNLRNPKFRMNAYKRILK